MTATKEQAKAGWKKAAARANAGRGFTEAQEPAQAPEPTTAAARGWKAAAERANAARG